MNPTRVVIVTGGTFGIGRAVTLSLAARGHSVVAFGLETVQVSSTAANAIPGLEAELEQRGLQAPDQLDVVLDREAHAPEDLRLSDHGTGSTHGPTPCQHLPRSSRPLFAGHPFIARTSK